MTDFNQLHFPHAYIFGGTLVKYLTQNCKINLRRTGPLQHRLGLKSPLESSLLDAGECSILTPFNARG